MKKFFKFIRGYIILLRNTCQKDGLGATFIKGFKYIFCLIYRLPPVRWLVLYMHDIFWKAYAAVFNKRLAHFIGDSHTEVFRLQAGMIAHTILGATAHNLVKKKSTSGSRKFLFKNLANINNKRDVLITVFGEVDCRIHFYWQYMKNQEKFTIEELINHTISNYGEVLKELKENGTVFCVCGVPPANKQENFYKYPFYGTPELRSNITKMFNQKLEHFCNDNGYFFINIYEPASDYNGFMKSEYAEDETHLNRKIVPYVRMQLKEKFKSWVF